MTDKELDKFVEKMMRKIIDKAVTFCEKKYPWASPADIAVVVDEVIMNLAARAAADVMIDRSESANDRKEHYIEYITHLGELMDIQIEKESCDDYE